ncbi:hypothetical protein [Streptomyces atratus]|uniref:hypothetical protein n=1 Tax=Streptomyces atratus TaxID=1893 RepID=UPI002253528D|nr:hypothetical protein [Streptomyces atratus]MCX5342052.1 hypothetical protein [Streptomyces atratus]
MASGPSSRQAAYAIPGRRLRIHIPRILSDLGVGGVAAVRSQYRIDPPAGDRPLLPFLLGCGHFGLDAVGLFTQPVNSTASSDLLLFQ